MADPTMSELTQQVQHALAFNSSISDISTAGESNSAEQLGILISAWNENDEGHWIVPSLQGGAAKLQAVAAAINAHKQRRQAYWRHFKTDDDDDVAKVVDTVHAPKEVRSSLIGLEKLETDETRSDVGAIYFGDWAPDPWMEAMHGTNWTEWQLPIHAQPRYPGHFQPNLPLETAGWGPAHPETDPANMAIKVDAAADHGIDFFMFDWYHLCQIILATVFLFLRS